MNRIIDLFEQKKEQVLNVYFTAGHPDLHDTITIVRKLSNLGVDLIEIGMPYSDPMADGETIQKSSQKALKNGMTLSLLIKQVKEIRKFSETPIILMGYYNQMMQFGEERFLSEISSAGVDGLIIPDLPMDVFQTKYKDQFEKYNLTMSFLITPETSDERIRKADEVGSGFIYVVSKSSITGTSSGISPKQKSYFDRIKRLDLKTPTLIGFGIHDQATYNTACQYSNGAIIGSAFIRALDQDANIEDNISHFISQIR